MHLNLMALKLLLGNAVLEAPASRETLKLELARHWFPGLSFRRYTQVRASGKSRHFGRDAEIQAMDGNKSVMQ